MVDRPIIFSAPMVLALLEGRKTQTRRLAWGKDLGHCANCGTHHPATLLDGCEYWPHKPTIWQKVQPGDRLWVKETWNRVPDAQWGQGWDRKSYKPAYRATDDLLRIKWKSSIHMPRRLSRLTLDVTATKMERLRHITEQDAAGEGFAADEQGNGWHHFLDYWNQLHGEGATDANPEVVALIFTVHKRNIDEVQP